MMWQCGIAVARCGSAMHGYSFAFGWPCLCFSSLPLLPVWILLLVDYTSLSRPLYSGQSYRSQPRKASYRRALSLRSAHAPRAKLGGAWGRHTSLLLLHCILAETGSCTSGYTFRACLTKSDHCAQGSPSISPGWPAPQSTTPRRTTMLATASRAY